MQNQTYEFDISDIENSLKSIRLVSRSRIRHRIRGDGIPSARHINFNDAPVGIENNGGFG
jgi:hypothetical protein